MTPEFLLENLKSSFGHHLRLVEIKPNTYQVFLPYYHTDWDMIDVFIEVYSKEKFIVKDFWQTMLRLSYDTDIDSDTRKSIFDKVIASYNIEHDTENNILYTTVERINDLFSAISELITVILKVSDISFLKEERMRNMFYKMFDSFVNDKLNHLNINKNYSFSFDQKWDYKAPYMFFSTKKTPILLIPILNTDKCTEYLSSHWFYRANNLKFRTIASFYDLEQISSKVRWKFIDQVDKPFSSFNDNKERIIPYLEEVREIY